MNDMFSLSIGAFLNNASTAFWAKLKHGFSCPYNKWIKETPKYNFKCILLLKEVPFATFPSSDFYEWHGKKNLNVAVQE